MFLQAKIVCPHCQSSHCRKSKWQTLDEKQTHPGSNPFRCLDCSHRFLQPERLAVSRQLQVPLHVAIIAVVLSSAVTFWLTRSDTEPVANASEALVTYDPEIRKAAEAGDAGAQFKLGEALLQNPTRSTENSENALHWLKRAADNGNTEAMIVLGRLLRSGVGVLQNFGQASQWLETAAKKGNSEGMLELGRLYRDGVGVDKDPVLAYVWFNRASAERNLDAVREREAIARILTPEELKKAQNQSPSL